MATNTPLNNKGVPDEVRLYVDEIANRQDAQIARQMEAMRQTLAEMNRRTELSRNSTQQVLDLLNARLERFMSSPANTITRAKLIDLINSGEIK